jgi:hypothetical protein
VDTCVKFQVETFLATIKAITDIDNPNKNYRIGDYTLTDLQRSQVYSAALTLRSYFGVFGDITKMWVTLSKENVLPGLQMCDELSVTASENDSGAMAGKVRQLAQWSQEASGRVKASYLSPMDSRIAFLFLSLCRPTLTYIQQDIAGDKQREIMDGMQSRIDDAATTTKAISPPPPSTLQAITAGTEVTKEAAQKSIEQRAKTSALSRFSQCFLIFHVPLCIYSVDTSTLSSYCR